jgi:hypothetical protein
MRQWIAGAEQHDDVTFVVVTMTAAGAAAASSAFLNVRQSRAWRISVSPR